LIEEHRMLGDVTFRKRLAMGVAPMAVAAVGLAGVVPANAVNADHGDRVVSANPADNTPHVMNGAVLAIVQIGNKIVAAGTFTSVSPAGTFSNTADDVVRNRIFAFDATTGAIDPTFNPNLGGSANSLDTDGTHIYVGGGFGSVGGNTAIRRVAKLTANGAVVSGFNAVPSAGVNEVVVRGDRLFLGGGFTSIRSGGVTTTRNAFAVVNSSTGAVLPSVNVPFTGQYNGGSTNITRMDVNPAGDQVVAVGNFVTVAGQPREQIALVDTPAVGQASLSSWSTEGFSRARNSCASVFSTFMRDVDWAPDGSYFAVTTTGAWAGGAFSGTLCDTITRWEAGRTGPDQEPTWRNYTGGDTSYGVAVTGAAIYVGGHMRWVNNPFAGDNAGPGAVPREGIVALDPVNGLPLSWNPGRSRGVGAQAMYATPQGLWVGSDTTRIGRETHGRVAFLPLAGGRTVPTVAPTSLPNTFFAAQSTICEGEDGVLYRVNAGGGTVEDATLGPRWESDDPFRNTGNGADWGSPVPSVDQTVPACTSPNIFRTERWDSGDAPELRYSFPVPAGTDVKVRLYFADRCGCTATAGSRVFDVFVEDQLRIDDFDINREVGHDRGTMREWTVTSDGSIDIEFGHVVENPLVNGIEILEATSNGPQPAGAGVLESRSVDGNGAPTSAPTTVNTSFDWSTIRGAFLVNGTLYFGLADGRLAKRTFNATTGAVGAQQIVNLYDDPDNGERIPFPISSMSGLFYDTGSHRIYYTVSGDSRLFYRHFTPESEVVGAETYEASNGGVDLSNVAGMTLAGGKVFFGSRTDGALRSVGFSISGLDGSVSEISTDGTWTHRGLFAPNG
jgi:hypothetical protein